LVLSFRELDDDDGVDMIRAMKCVSEIITISGKECIVTIS